MDGSSCWVDFGKLVDCLYIYIAFVFVSVFVFVFVFGYKTWVDFGKFEDWLYSRLAHQCQAPTHNSLMANITLARYFHLLTFLQIGRTTRAG